MKAFATCIVEMLIGRKIISSQEKEIYIYGFDLWIYTIASTLFILIIGILFSRFSEILLLLFFFYNNQSLGGGYHATTHARCFFCMICGSLSYLILLSLFNKTSLTIFIGIASLCILWIFPLTLHPNKSHLAFKRHIFIARSKRFIIFSFFALCLACHSKCHQLYNSISLSILFCALSRLVAVFQRKIKGFL